MMMISNSPDVLTVQEAARTLRVSRTTMYHLVNTGQVKHLKIGRKILITREYLQKYIENATEMCYNDTQKVGTLPCRGKGV